MFGRKGVQATQGVGTNPQESPLTREIRGILAVAADQHPLDVAAQLAALFSAQDYTDDRIVFIRVRDIDHPTVCDLSLEAGNPVGLSFSFSGMTGEEGLIYLTTDFAQLAQRGTESGPRVPAEMIARYVPEYVNAVRKLVVQRSPRPPLSITLN